MKLHAAITCCLRLYVGARCSQQAGAAAAAACVWRLALPEALGGMSGYRTLRATVRVYSGETAGGRFAEIMR